MLPFKPKIVFFDIDDTIYHKNTDTLRPSVYRAMHALKQQGILTAIATGRPPIAIPEKVRQLIRECGIDILVTINGQYTEFHGKILKAFPLDRNEIAELCTVFQQNNLAYAFVGSQTIAVSENRSEVEESLRYIYPNFITDRDFFLQNEVYQMLIFAKEEEDAELLAQMRLAGYKSARWHTAALDLLPISRSKIQGIGLAAAELGITTAEIMAFGDGLNDLEMLSGVGFGVAMANGAEQAKALARYVCPSVDEDGVYRGLIDLGVIPAE